MIFTEFRFLAFFAAVFAVYWLLESERSRKAWLLIASYGFYAAWDWRFLSLIVISSLVDYVVGLRLADSTSDRSRKGWVTASIITNLGMLGFFKYFGFFVDSAEDFAHLLGLGFSRPAMQIVLPVGISFFTFQTMSYSIDVYRRRMEPTRSALDLFLFVAFFPQLVAGPIVRASHFLPQMLTKHRLEGISFRPLLVLFLGGFIKKACISDNISGVVDVYFADPQAFGAAAAWLAVVLYAVQIYCDFSGYSDMAIATAGMLGYDLGANFDAPYLASNIRDFWRRWHISLSTWLRDYLYIPLGGSRGSEWMTRRNLFITMALGGLWHGASWRFVVWGVLHGLALIIHRAISASSPRPSFAERGLVFQTAGIAATFWFTCVCWVFFRATSFPDALLAVKAFVLFDSPGEGTLDTAWWGVIALVTLIQILARRLPRGWEILPRWSFGFAYGVAIGIALLFVDTDPQPFIYFQF